MHRCKSQLREVSFCCRWASKGLAHLPQRQNRTPGTKSESAAYSGGDATHPASVESVEFGWSPWTGFIFWGLTAE